MRGNLFDEINTIKCIGTNNFCYSPNLSFGSYNTSTSKTVTNGDEAYKIEVVKKDSINITFIISINGRVGIPDYFNKAEFVAVNIDDSNNIIKYDCNIISKENGIIKLTEDSIDNVGYYIYSLKLKGDNKTLTVIKNGIFIIDDCIGC